MPNNDVPGEYMHCFSITDEIPKYEPMEIEQEAVDLFETVNLEWHYWENTESSTKKPEPSLRKLLEFAGYQISQEEAEMRQQSKTEQLKQAKVRGPYRSYPPKQIQGLLDLVIEQGLSTCKAGLIVGTVERTAQHYVKQYKDDEENSFPGQRKRTQRIGKLEPCHTEFLCSFFVKRPEALLWQARDALLDKFQHAHSQEIWVNKKGHASQICYTFEQRSYSDYHWVICEKVVVELTLRKPKAVQKKNCTTKKRKRDNGKAGEVEVSARVGTRSEHCLDFLSSLMDALDQFKMQDCYLVMDNAAIHKVDEIQELMTSRGYKIAYLPPYSSFLNPIESFWSKIKGNIRRDCLSANDNLSARITEFAKKMLSP
ncbi:hypothetical protein G6F43_012090 [Rhizopus delemar]|nr:hypothetical protein G6F43_012090 [Rhizopus delemar]